MPEDDKASGNASQTVYMCTLLINASSFSAQLQQSADVDPAYRGGRFGNTLPVIDQTDWSPAELLHNIDASSVNLSLVPIHFIICPFYTVIDRPSLSNKQLFHKKKNKLTWAFLLLLRACKDETNQTEINNSNDH